MIFSNISIFCPDGKVLANAFLQVKGKKIVFVGTNMPQEDNDERYDGKGKLLLPGFVNTHCHVPMTLLRSVGADLPLQSWLTERIFPLEAKLLAEDAYYGSLLGIGEMLRSGVTSFSDMYFDFGKERIQASLQTGIKENFSMGILAEGKIPFSQMKMVRQTKEMFSLYHGVNDGQILVDVGIHAEYTSNQSVVKEAATLAGELGVNTQVHLSETRLETEACQKRHQKTPTAYFADLGFFDHHTTAAHCVCLTEKDRQILQKKEVFVSHCPVSNLKLGSGIADVGAMVEAGIAVTIGTDGTASNDNLNYLEDMKLASLLIKGSHNNPLLGKVVDTIKMATKIGALAQGRPDTGEIKVGNRADLVMVDLSTINMQPASEPLTTFLYAGLPSDVEMTMVDGKVLYQNGKFMTIDMELVLGKIKEIGKRLYG